MRIINYIQLTRTNLEGNVKKSTLWVDLMTDTITQSQFRMIVKYLKKRVK